jgi:BolA protein
MSEKRMKLIRESLEKLRPSSVDIEDEGHLHIGHAGAKSGGHFKLNIVSESFKDKSTIERHKIIYKCLNGLMNTEIHAISIKAKSKDEV